MKKTYYLCDLTSQQIINLENRIRSGKYHTIQVFNRKYYNDDKYTESDIQIYKADFIKDNMDYISHSGIWLKCALIIRGNYIKVWY